MKLYYARASDNTMDDYCLDLMVRAASPEAVMTAVLDYYQIPACHFEGGAVRVCVVPEGPGPVDWSKMYDAGVMVAAEGGEKYEDIDNE